MKNTVRLIFGITLIILVSCSQRNKDKQESAAEVVARVSASFEGDLTQEIIFNRIDKFLLSTKDKGLQVLYVNDQHVPQIIITPETKKTIVEIYFNSDSQVLGEVTIDFLNDRPGEWFGYKMTADFEFTHSSYSNHPWLLTGANGIGVHSHFWGWVGSDATLDNWNDYLSKNQ